MALLSKLEQSDVPFPATGSPLPQTEACIDSAPKGTMGGGKPAPAVGRALEYLARQIQSLMSKLIDEVKEGIKGIEDLVRRNSRAGMLCSAQLILFRQLSQQLLDLLVAPRPGDELGRARRG